MGRTPRLLIGAARSGAGKTLITCALLKALQKKKKQAVSFKCGPDYIDPLFHREALGIDSDNLDSFLCTPDQVRAFLRSGREIVRSRCWKGSWVTMTAWEE